MIQNAKIVGTGITPEVYTRQEPGVERGDPMFVMSRGELMAFAACPHKWMKVGSGFEGSAASDWGSAIDCLLLTPSEWDARFAVKPETYLDSKTGEPKPFTMSSNWCKKWAEEQGEKTLVKHDEYEEMQSAIAALGDTDVSRFLPKAQKQVMAVAEWADKATGLVVPIKVLLDLVPAKDDPEFGKVILDLKTTTNASEKAWCDKVDRENYDAQGALFFDVYRSATGEDRCEFWHIVQETDAPYEVAIWRFGTGMEGGEPGFLDLGRIKYESALERYCQCLSTGKWYGYTGPTLRYLQPKPWMMNR